MKRQATIAHTPKAILVSQTYFKLSAYAHRVPIVAASMISAVTPGTEAILVGAPKKVLTNNGASAIGRPALIAHSATYAGNLGVSLLMKTL